MSTELKHKILSGVFWQGIERGGSQLFQLALQIVLARLLLPSDFGAVILLTVFIQVALVFIDSGLGTALVQHKTPAQEDFSGVFWINIPISCLFYVIIFALAPYVEKFYQIDGLGLMLRVIALSLFFYGLTNVPLAIAQRQMAFNKLFLINFPGTIGSGAVGVVMALQGWGAWSLVWMQLSGAFFRMILAYWLVGWLPGLHVRWHSLFKMLNFSYKLLLTSLLDVLVNNLYYLVIGKWFAPAQLGYYSKACKFPQFVMTGVQGTIGSVIFPALSSCQHDLVKMKEIVRKAITVSSFMMAPLMFGLMGCAKSVVLILLGENWLPAVPYLRLTPLIFIFWPLHVANLQTIIALGRSDLLLILEILKKTSIIAGIFIGVYWGIFGIVIAQVICSATAFFFNAWPNRKLIDYSIWTQTIDIAPIWGCSLVMGILLWGIEKININIYCIFILQLLCGILCYGIGVLIFKRSTCRYLWSTGMDLWKKVRS